MQILTSFTTPSFPSFICALGMYPAGFDYMAPPPPYPGPPQNWAAPPQNWTATAPPLGDSFQFSVLLHMSVFWLLMSVSLHLSDVICLFLALMLNHIESCHPQKRGRTADVSFATCQNWKSYFASSFFFFFFSSPHTLWIKVQTVRVWVDPCSVLRRQFGVLLFLKERARVGVCILGVRQWIFFVENSGTHPPHHPIISPCSVGGCSAQS